VKKRVDAKLISKDDVIELEAFGLTAGMERARPVILFREKGGEAVLPVWMSPLDAEIALTLSSGKSPSSSPYLVSLAIFERLGVKIETCHFRDLKGHQQYVEVNLSGSRKLKTVRVRADQAISMCLQAKARFFCTRDFIRQCREVEAELAEMQVGLNSQSTRVHSYYLN
jgi:bifunctional DNase/RNase